MATPFSSKSNGYTPLAEQMLPGLIPGDQLEDMFIARGLVEAELEFGEYRDDPVGFCRDILGIELWGSEESPTDHPGQRGMAEALMETKRVTACSCNGAGKTFFASCLVLWFMCTRKNAIVVSVAPTWTQVTELLWANLRNNHAKAKKQLPGKPNKTGQWELGPMWYAVGKSTDSEERFQGIHPDVDGEVLVVVDEASGVQDFAYRAIRGYLTKPDCYVLYIGNGNKAEGEFYESFQREHWARFHIAAWDTPEYIIDRSWIDEMREDYGEGSIPWIVRVAGQFPSSGSDRQLFPTFLIQSCDGLTPSDPMSDGLHIGLDVARHGKDYSVATLTENGVVKAVEAWQTPDLMETWQNTKELAIAWGVIDECIHIDIGMGAGVIDRFAEDGWIVDTVDFGSGPKGEWREVTGDMKFQNRKAELHWAGRQLLMKKRVSIPPRFGLTRKQLGWLNYDIKENGVLQVEPKAKLKTRGIEDSPDYADSWIISLSRMGAGSGISFL